MARMQSSGSSAGKRKPRRISPKNGDTGPYFESGGPRTPAAGRRARPQGVKRVAKVAPAKRRTPSASSIAASNYRRTSSLKGAKAAPNKKMNIRLPKVDINPGKAVRDAFGNTAPQDILFKNIGDRIKGALGGRQAGSRISGRSRPQTRTKTRYRTR